jgi:hypothetical protein
MNELLGNKQVAITILALGVMVALLSILIDPIRGVALYLAAIQIVGLIVGVILALIGGFLAFFYKMAVEE